MKNTVPRKDDLRYETERYICHTGMDGEQVMVEADGGFAGMVRSNATAAFIIDQLKTETTKEAILDAMCKKVRCPRAVMAEDVDMVLANLKKIGALDA